VDVQKAFSSQLLAFDLQLSMAVQVLPSPENPGRHRHVLLPAEVWVQVASSLQPPLLLSQGLISTQLIVSSSSTAT
jgi:hypothetical protein